MPHIKAGLILMLFGMLGVYLILVLIQLIINMMIALDAKFSRNKAEKKKSGAVPPQVLSPQTQSKEDIYIKVAVAAALHHHKIKRNTHG